VILRRARVLGALLCVACAVLLLLLAIDVRAWDERLAADDLRYRANPVHGNLWKPSQTAPFGLARAVLGIQDDLKYREALRLFRLGRPLENNLYGIETSTLRAEAQVEMGDVADSGPDLARRSQAANLLGVLGFSMAARDLSLKDTFLRDAISSFRQAIGLDPTNDEALFNLEFSLQELKVDEQQQLRGASGANAGGNAGLKPPGRGF
jgi:tetratricopeptide (TPR) repeat protein